MNAVLKEASFHHRMLEVQISGFTHVVQYCGSVGGAESILVDGIEIAKQQRVLGSVLRFRFTLSSRPVMLEVRVWPWTSVRAVHLWVADELIYAEGRRLLGSPADLAKQEALDDARRFAFMMLGFGAISIGMNVLMWVMGRFYPVMLLLTPLCILLGTAGAVDPRICVLGKASEMHKFPFWTKAVGFYLGAFGFALGMLLVGLAWGG